MSAFRTRSKVREMEWNYIRLLVYFIQIPFEKRGFKYWFSSVRLSFRSKQIYSLNFYQGLLMKATWFLMCSDFTPVKHLVSDLWWTFMSNVKVIVKFFTEISMTVTWYLVCSSLSKAYIHANRFHTCRTRTDLILWNITFKYGAFV